MKLSSSRTVCLQISVLLEDIDPALSELMKRVSIDEHMGYIVLHRQISNIQPDAPNGVATLDCPKCVSETRVKNYQIYRRETITCWKCRRTLIRNESN